MIRLAVPLALIVAWATATGAGWIKSYQLASPRDVAREVVELASTGVLWHDLGASVSRLNSLSRSPTKKFSLVTRRPST